MNASGTAGYPKRSVRVFVASSSKSIAVADSLKLALSTDEVVVVPWKELGVFLLSEHTIQSLEDAANTCQYAVFLLGEDDLIKRKDEEFSVPRDNVVFELGLFLGRIGRKRSYMLKPRGVEVRLPSDLSGITWAEFSDMGEDRVDLSEACAQVRAAMKRAPLSPIASILSKTLFPPLVMNYCYRRFRRFLRRRIRLFLPRFKCDAQVIICRPEGVILRHPRAISHGQNARNHEGAILWSSFPFRPGDRPLDVLLRTHGSNGWVVWADEGYSQLYNPIAGRGNQRVCVACSEWRRRVVYFLEMHQELTESLNDYLLAEVGQIIGDRLRSLREEAQ